MIAASLFQLTFQASVEKSAVEGCYALVTEDFNLNVAPMMAEHILTSPEGGLFMDSAGIAVIIDPEEDNPEELLARYPGASKLIQ